MVVLVHVGEEVQHGDILEVERRVVARPVAVFLARELDARRARRRVEDPVPLVRRAGAVHDERPRTEPADHVHVQHRARVLERHGRVRGVVRRAQ